MSRLVRLALLGATAVGCASVRPAPRSPDDAEVRRVYAAVLAEVRPPRATRPVVIDTLMPVTDLDADQHEMISGELAISRQALDAFVAAQQRTRGSIRSAMPPDSAWRIVAPTTLDSLRGAARAQVATGATTARGRNDAFWSRWNTLFPGSDGYVVLSPISFSADGADALVHVRTACGPVCGESHLRRLQRDAQGRWRTVGRVELSVS